MEKVTVTRGRWFVAFSSSYPSVEVTLSVFRVVRLRGKDRHVNGDHDKRKFANVKIARRFCIEHGYLQVYNKKMVY